MSDPRDMTIKMSISYEEAQAYLAKNKAKAMITETPTVSLEERVAEALETVGYQFFDDSGDDCTCSFGMPDLIRELAVRNLKIVEMKDGE